MIDAIVAVDNPLSWHESNMRANRSHYSPLARVCGPATVAHVAGTGGVYFNAMVPVPKAAGGPGAGSGRLWKYGVVAEAALIEDLVSWRWLYLAGRLHKPVRWVATGSPALRAAARENLRHALRAALLQLPAAFTAEQLFARIAGLSYTGDFRMVFGENPNKVADIVAASAAPLYALYLPLLHAHFPTVTGYSAGAIASPASAVDSGNLVRAGHSLSRDGGFDDNDAPPPSEAPLPTLFRQDVSPEARLAMGLSLPYELQRRMAAAYAERARAGDRWVGLRRLVAAGASATARAATAAAARPSVFRSLPVTPIDAESRAHSAVGIRARALAFARAGRELMQRARQQRLQWLVSRRERGGALAGTAGAIDSAARARLRRDEERALREDVIGSSGDSGGDSGSGRASGGARGIAGEGSAAHASFARASRDAQVVAFWDALLSRGVLAGDETGGGGTRGSAPLVLSTAAAAGLTHSGGGVAAVPRAAASSLRGGDSAAGESVAVLRSHLQPALAHIVGASARAQALRGMFSTSPARAVVYLALKLQKYATVVFGLGRRRG